MGRSFGFKSVLGAVGLGIGALSLVVGATGVGAAKPAPVVTVKPDTNLKATQNVKVSGKHLGDDTSVVIVQCWSGDQTENGCNINNVGSGQASSTGVLAPTTFKVTEKLKTSGDKTINCLTNADPCVVVVANAANDTELGAAVISFAPAS
jgi:hypothetical protein